MAAPIHIDFFWDESLSHFADSAGSVSADTAPTAGHPAGSNPAGDSDDARDGSGLRVAAPAGSNPARDSEEARDGSGLRVAAPAGSNPAGNEPPISRDFQSWAPPFDPRWAEWLQSELRLLGWMHGRVTYLFASDDAVLEMNRKHLQHDYYTDILTFDQSHHPVLEVDLAISMERIMDHAASLNIAPARELARVLIHGLLHVSGWDDHSEEDRQAMRRAEEESLQRCPLLSNDHA